MRKNLETINYPRIFLYIIGSIICGILGFMHFYVTPRYEQQKMIEKIKELYMSKKYKPAIEKCEKLLAAFPRQGEAFFWLGKCHDAVVEDIEFKQKRIEDFSLRAKNEFYTREQRQKNEEISQRLAEDISRWGDREQFGKKALEAYARCLEFSPHWDAVMDVAEAHLSAKRYDHASKALGSLNESDAPERKLQHTFLDLEIKSRMALEKKSGLVALEKEYLSALESYKKLAPESRSLVLRRNASLICWYLGQIAESRNDLPQANQYYQEAIGIFSEDFTFYYAWGKNLVRAERYGEAEAVLSKGIKWMSGASSLRYELALSRLRLWKIEEAIADLENVFFQDRFSPELSMMDAVKKEDLWKRCSWHPDFQMLMQWGHDVPLESLQESRNALHDVFRKKFDSATASCQQVLGKDPGNYPAQMMLLRSSIGKKAQKLSLENELKVSEEALKDEKTPLLQKILLNNRILQLKKELQSENMASFSIEECDRRIQDLEQALKKNHDAAHVDFWMAHAYSKYELQEESFRRIEALLPSVQEKEWQATLHFMKSDFFIQSKEYSKAVDELSLSVSCFPANPTFLFHKAQVLHYQGKSNEAMQDYERLIQMEPNVPRYRYYFGLTCLSLKQYEKAALQFKQAFDLNPHLYLARYQQAKTALFQNDKEESLKLLQEAFEKGNVKELGRMVREEKSWKALSEDPRFIKIISAEASPF